MNNAGVYTVNVYIRGKPWLITLDDILEFEDESIISPIIKPDSEPHLYFSRASFDGKYHIFWGTLLEKAFAKMNTNYSNLRAGLLVNGMQLLLGCPVRDNGRLN